MLYDRAALVALPSKMRRKYVDQCESSLSKQAALILVTLEYDEAEMRRSPVSVSEEEVAAYRRCGRARA